MGILLIVLFVTSGVILAKDILGAKSFLDQAKGDLTTAAKLAKNMEFANSKAHFEKAGYSFLNAQKSLNQPIVKAASFVPVVNQNINAAIALASSGAEVARAGQLLSMASMQFPTKNGKPAFGIANGRINLSPFFAAQTYLKGADTHAQMAIAEYKKVPNGLLLPSIRSAGQELGEELKRLKKTTSITRRVFDILPDALGAKEKRRYFLAVQNNAELRATGGLIGCYGVMTVENGKFSLDDFDKTSARPTKNRPVKAPRDFVDRYSRFKSTTIWSNANMSPDFPIVSGVLLGLYKSNAGEDLDGVISIDPVGLQYLLEATGSVRVPKAATNINAGNVVNWTLIEAYNKYKGKERRDFLVDVTRAVWDKLLSGQINDRQKLISQLASAFNDKHMMLFSTNKEEQKIFEELGYAGALIPTACDYLQVLMQNHGANKVDVYLHESIDYSIKLSKDGSARAKVIVKVTNRTPKFGLPLLVAGEDPLGARNGYSNTYLSVYVPKGAQLMDTTVDGKPGGAEVGYEKDKTIFSYYLYIAPRTSRTASFIYDLPNALIFDGKDIDYILDCQAQPVINHADIAISIELPKGFKVSSLPVSVKKKGRKLTLSKSLARDERLEIGLSSSQRN